MLDCVSVQSNSRHGWHFDWMTLQFPGCWVTFSLEEGQSLVHMTGLYWMFPHLRSPSRRWWNTAVFNLISICTQERLGLGNAGRSAGVWTRCGRECATTAELRCFNQERAAKRGCNGTRNQCCGHGRWPRYRCNEFHHWQISHTAAGSNSQIFRGGWTQDHEGRRVISVFTEINHAIIKIVCFKIVFPSQLGFVTHLACG